VIGRHLIASLPLLLLSACSVEPLPPEGQVLFYVDTDTLLPSPLDPDRAEAPLFDRLRLEIFEPDAREPCVGCTREIGIDHETVFEGRASVGIIPRPNQDGYRVRVRLYRVAGADLVEPRPTSTLEAVARLPEVKDEGIVEAHVVLRTEDLGAPQGTLEEPIDALPGPAEGGLAGTFASDVRRGCDGAPAEGEVCVPGGAFWMGDLTLGDTYGDALSERLVVVSPYYLDATEVTVGRWRASGMTTTGNITPHSSFQPFCNYTSKAVEFEGHPVNCVTREAALAFCAMRGARLPTEAEWELAASARRSAYAVWGNDPPGCEDAVFARSDDANLPEATMECAAYGVGSAAVGSGVRDRLVLDGGTLVDLAGNVSEWVADAWAKEGDPCWTGPLLRDPVCTSEDASTPYTIRGANWEHGAANLRAAQRADVSAAGKPYSILIGFRCARAG
jgi:formylglycine-generating enzyme